MLEADASIGMRCSARNTRAHAWTAASATCRGFEAEPAAALSGAVNSYCPIAAPVCAIQCAESATQPQHNCNNNCARWSGPYCIRCRADVCSAIADFELSVSHFPFGQLAILQNSKRARLLFGYARNHTPAAALTCAAVPYSNGRYPRAKHSTINHLQFH